MYAQKRKNFPVVVVFVLLSAAALLVLNNFNFLIRNQEHANERHQESIMVRKTYNDGICEGSEVYYSPVLGTVLVLCGIPNSNLWGGMPFRITENRSEGRVFLDDQCYECTAFVAQRKYWDNVIKKRGYIPIYLAPDIERYFQEWYNGNK